MSFTDFTQKIHIVLYILSIHQKMYYTLRINSMKWNMRYLFGFLVPFPFPSPVWKTGIICFLSRRSMTCIENFNIPHTQGQPLPPVIRTFDNLHIQIPFPMGQKLCLNAPPIFFFLKVKSAPWLVMFPHSPYYIMYSVLG